MDRTLQSLPAYLPIEEAVRIDLEEGVLVLRASTWLQTRIETLLDQQKSRPLSLSESQELDAYEEIDDYFSLVNRTIRNLSLEPTLHSSTL